MNTLEQQHKIFLLGSISEIEKLNSKTEARILVVSDSHGNSAVLQNIIEKEGIHCDAMIFTGDGFYDLQKILEQSVFDESLNEKIPPVVAFVQGNGDMDFSNCALKKDGTIERIFISNNISMQICGLNIFVTHGHEYDVYFGTKELERVAKGTNKADIIFFGHTHRRFFERKENITLINPGSCSRPRDKFPPAYCIATIRDNNIFPEFFDAVF